MVRLDLTTFKYLTSDDFRVLQAIELGMRNHEFVPLDLIESIAKLKRVNVFQIVQGLQKNRLISHTGKNYSGYCVNYLGYDYLAIRVLVKKGILVKILSRMGVGKESDVFYCLINSDVNNRKELNEEELNNMQKNLLGDDLDFDKASDNGDDDDLIGEKEENEDEEDEESEKSDKIEDQVAYYEDYNQLKDVYDNKFSNMKLVSGILKLARLGRTSFRAVKNKRDFAKNKTHFNWMYLSRLSSETEFKFLTGLHKNNFPVPEPYGHNRHAIIMKYIPSFQLSRVNKIANPEVIYNHLNQIIYKFAEVGLVHGDFNEFNILISKEEKIHIIDFTQMISIDHEKAESYFVRDLKGVKDYFRKKFCLCFPDEKDSIIDFQEVKKRRLDYLDVKLNAFGCIKKLDREELEEIMNNEDDIMIDDDDLINELNNKNKSTKKEHDTDKLEDDELGNILNLDIDQNNDEKDNNKEQTQITKDNHAKQIVITRKDVTKKVMKGIHNENKIQNKFKTKGSVKNKKTLNRNEIKVDKNMIYD